MSNLLHFGRSDWQLGSIRRVAEILGRSKPTRHRLELLPVLDGSDIVTLIILF